MFSLISFLKNLSRMKRRWREDLQLPVTIKRSLVAINDKNCSSDIGSFDSFRSKFFAKAISRFKSFSLNEYDLLKLSSAFLMEMFDRQGKELKYAKELLVHHYRKSIQNSEVAGHVGKVKTVVTNYLRKMFRSRINKAGECNTTARINWDNLTETNT